MSKDTLVPSAPCVAPEPFGLVEADTAPEGVIANRTMSWAVFVADDTFSVAERLWLGVNGAIPYGRASTLVDNILRRGGIAFLTRG